MCAFPFWEKGKQKAAMADYRFSAKVISRSKGQSSVASAAYRAAERLIDERTGEIHDYGRKGGLIHSEVMAPADTPEWMQDRVQLWNAVEAVERRKDAQLAREIQLSLPHELTPEQRADLARGFVQEQFVNQGMIADLVIHAPSAKGDERNHHAHVMLTMREITGEGFGKKNRDWNSPDHLAKWRESWAQHQNRALERHGHTARVDHRSYEAQGIDRQPTQHLGPVANDMERKGRPSRIGEQNREIINQNSQQAAAHVEAAQLRTQIAELVPANTNTPEKYNHPPDNLRQIHAAQIRQLSAQHEQEDGPALKTMQAELDAINGRLETGGLKKFLRDVFGRSEQDRQTKILIEQGLQDIRDRQAKERAALEQRQEQQKAPQKPVQRDQEIPAPDATQKPPEAARGDPRASEGYNLREQFDDVMKRRREFEDRMREEQRRAEERAQQDRSRGGPSRGGYER